MRRLNLNCDSCGAPVTGLICDHCGKLTAHLESVADENRALNEFHKQLQRLSPGEQRMWLLESGFLPNHKEVLISAGASCIVLMRNSVTCEAAATRLEAIVIKLRSLPRDQQTRRAIEDFQAKIREHKSSLMSDTLWGVGCILLIAVAVLVVAWMLVRDFALAAAVALVVGLIVLFKVVLQR